MEEGVALVLSIVLVGACGSDPSAAPDASSDAGVTGPATSLFDLDGNAGRTSDFFDAPFPSDLRMADGTLDLTGYPNPRNNTLVANCSWEQKR
jgi:hypothetical protein